MVSKPERRAYKRFDVKLPATVHPDKEENGNDNHLLLTRDISCKGAYFRMMKPFTCNGRIGVEILIELFHDCDQSVYVYMATSGDVVRCDDSGLAVIFNEDFELVPFHMQ